jgi:hypothetical protein
MCPLLQAALEPHPAIVLADLRALYDRLHRALIVGQLEAGPAHPAGRGNVPVGHDADPGQRPVEALPRPVAPRDRLVDARGEQQLGWDLARALGHPDLVPAHAGPAAMIGRVVSPVLRAHALRVDGVRQAVLPLQRVDDAGAAPLLVAIADRLAVEVDPRRHDMHMVFGVLDDDIGRVPKTHALQVIPGEGGPRGIAQVLAGGQAQGAMVDRPRQVGVEPARLAELTRQLAGGGTFDIAAHDARLLVLQLRALLEHVVEHAPEAPPGDNLLDHALSPLALCPHP